MMVLRENILGFKLPSDSVQRILRLYEGIAFFRLYIYISILDRIRFRDKS